MRARHAGILLCCLFLGLFLSLFLPVQAVPLRVVVNHAPPYRIIDPPHYTGYYIELLKLGAAEAGLEIEFVSVPLKRAFQMLEHGEADLLLGPNRTPEREKFLVFLREAPFLAEDKVFIVAHPEQLIRNMADLQHKRIDVLAGAVYHPDIDRTSQLHKHELKSYEQGLQRLMRDRSDVVIMPEAQADWLIHSLQLPLLKSPFHLRGTPSFIAWSRVTFNAELAHRLTLGMQYAQASPQGHKIRQQYFHLPTGH